MDLVFLPIITFPYHHSSFLNFIILNFKFMFHLSILFCFQDFYFLLYFLRLLVGINLLLQSVVKYLQLFIMFFLYGLVMVVILILIPLGLQMVDFFSFFEWFHRGCFLRFDFDLLLLALMIFCFLMVVN